MNPTLSLPIRTQIHLDFVLRPLHPRPATSTEAVETIVEVQASTSPETPESTTITDTSASQ